jgi:hypothetical protein
VVGDFKLSDDKLEFGFGTDGGMGGFAGVGFYNIHTNGNGITDPGDRGIDEQMATLHGQTALSTVIDVAILAYEAEPAPHHTVTLWGVVGLTEADFIPTRNGDDPPNSSDWLL